MTNLTPIECEARLVGLSKQRRKDGDWVEVKFHIHPDDHPAALFILPLGTQCMLSVRGAEESADETPEPAEQTQDRPKRQWHELSAREQSVLRCKEMSFQTWVCGIAEEDAAAREVRARCGVHSRTDFYGNAAAEQRWHQLEAAYRAAQQGRTESALLDQRDRRQTG